MDAKRANEFLARHFTDAQLTAADHEALIFISDALKAQGEAEPIYWLGAFDSAVGEYRLACRTYEEASATIAGDGMEMEPVPLYTHPQPASPAQARGLVWKTINEHHIEAETPFGTYCITALSDSFRCRGPGAHAIFEQVGGLNHAEKICQADFQKRFEECAR